MTKRDPSGRLLPDGMSWDDVKRRYRARYRDAAGNWKTVSLGKQFTRAKQRLSELKRDTRAGIVTTPRPRDATLTEYLEHFEHAQERKGRRNRARECNQLRRHVLPTFGDRTLHDVSPADISDLLWELYENGLSAKSIANLKGSLSSLYSRAVFERIVDVNPCKMIPNGELPRIGRHSWPKFERHEVERLLSDERIPDDRRVLYASAFFLGLRIGEACGLRFSDWDRTLEPLGGVTIDKQYQGEALKGSRDDFVAARRVPVHPELARILAWWKLAGFRAVYSRSPADEDLLVPRLGQDTRARSQSQAYKALVADMATVGVPHRPGRATHAFRKAFASMACDDDAGGMANQDVIKALTHTGRSRDVFERYKQWSWGTFCTAVRCVVIDIPAPGQVIRHGS